MSHLPTVEGNLFQRVAVAVELFDDLDWVAENCNGDRGTAAEVLAATYFPDLSSFIGLPNLREIYRAFPNEDQWAKYRYDVVCLSLLLEEEEKKSRPPAPRTNWKKRAAELEDERDTLLAENKQLRARLKELQAKPAK